MLGIKLIGAGLLFGVAIGNALHRTRLEKKRLAVLNAWIALLYRIREQIDCFCLPLDEILAEADTALLSEPSTKDTPVTLWGLLESSKPYLAVDCQSILASCIGELGASYREEQVKRCDVYLARLEAVREEEKSALPTRIKLTVTLNLCLWLGTSILLW